MIQLDRLCSTTNLQLNSKDRVVINCDALRRPDGSLISESLVVGTVNILCEVEHLHRIRDAIDARLFRLHVEGRPGRKAPTTEAEELAASFEVPT